MPIAMNNSSLGAVYLRLPAASGDQITVLRKIQETIEPLKTSPEPLVAGKLLAVFGLLPAAIVRPIWPALSNKVTGSVLHKPLVCCSVWRNAAVSSHRFHAYLYFLLFCSFDVEFARTSISHEIRWKSVIEVW